MINMQKIDVYVYPVEKSHPHIDAIEINEEVVGYLAENRDWNKDKKPVSVVTADGKHIGDFCCNDHAVVHIATKVTGIDFDEVHVSRNREKRFINDPFDLLIALAMLADQKGKRPH
ncbi:TPA: hypothetical protein QIB60_000505 [Enterobacter cloacae subsp. dissolvens]|nr:hypothetical protein [Enterobacter cloacae subsp. dissolvens]